MSKVFIFFFVAHMHSHVSTFHGSFIHEDPIPSLGGLRHERRLPCWLVGSHEGTGDGQKHHQVMKRIRTIFGSPIWKNTLPKTNTNSSSNPSVSGAMLVSGRICQQKYIYMILLRIFNYITTWFSEKKPYSRYATFFSTTNGRPTLSSTKHFWRLRCILEMHPHSMPEQPRLQRLQDFEAKSRQLLLIWWCKTVAKHIEAPPHQIKRSPSGNFQSCLVSWKVEILSIHPYASIHFHRVFFRQIRVSIMNVDNIKVYKDFGQRNATVSELRLPDFCGTTWEASKLPKSRKLPEYGHMISMISIKWCRIWVIGN